MTKKDYVLLGHVMRCHLNAVRNKTEARRSLLGVVANMVDAFQRDNELFDAERFLDAALPRGMRLEYDLLDVPELTLFDGTQA